MEESLSDHEDLQIVKKIEEEKIPSKNLSRLNRSFEAAQPINRGASNKRMSRDS